MELTGHLSEDVLIAYFCGELSEERAKKIQNHVRNCPPCTNEFNIHKMLFSGILAMLAKAGEKPTPSELRAALQENMRKNQVFYTILHIPNFAELLLARTQHGLANVMFGKFSRFEFEERLKKNFPRQWIVESFDETSEERRQFEAYFYREIRDFELAIDESVMSSSFQREVLFALREIPYGHFVTYGEIARRIGKPKATRAVGTALGHNPLPIILPCHRVVASGGDLGGFTGGLEYKLRLLAVEGITYPHSSRQMDIFNPFNPAQ